MKEAFHTIFEGGVGEFEMKKSRFIATVRPVETEEAAIDVIETLKKKYWDASHNCSAYIIGTENPIMRCSDDGEPSKTAGRPMLDVLLAHELTNLVVVVTRYFGGTLLGTGGLVKAYQSATLEGLKNSIVIKKELGVQLQVVTDYTLIGKIQYLIGTEKITQLSSEFTDIVTLTLLIPPSRLSEISKKIAELTNGSAILNEIDEVYFSLINGEAYVF
ncbi:YigZ family protein [Lachnospiraceae bacterium MD1]|uniref:YigZ family protein n=1 Tax=Variimorphobacter saccharofermentans TaxID=2755051 RepID=A0A839JWD9_9FIRM|nr:YigZ family protein [Variimorphobacter saccharofermentans]MBB2181995.1 YigZ family protein [Variimorphobacter saccharofermentans]